MTRELVTPATGVDDPVELLRRIADRQFMDMEGLAIICGDFIAKWDCRNSSPNANVDLPDTAAQDSASKSNNPAVSG